MQIPLANPNHNQQAKALGAYYTEAPVAEFLLWWGMRRHDDTVLDPSFGEGVFLEAACQRLSALGGQAATQIFGVEIDPIVHGRVATAFGIGQGSE